MLAMKHASMEKKSAFHSLVSESLMSYLHVALSCLHVTLSHISTWCSLIPPRGALSCLHVALSCLHVARWQHMALQGIPGLDFNMTGAFELSPVANAVYEHNFGLKPDQARYQKPPPR